MSEPYDRMDTAPPADERTGLRRAPVAALAVTGIVVSTVFATVAALAAGRGDEAQSPAPLDPGPVLVSTTVESSTETTDPTTEVQVAADPNTGATTTPRPTTTTKRKVTTTRVTTTTMTTTTTQAQPPPPPPPPPPTTTTTTTTTTTPPQ